MRFLARWLLMSLAVLLLGYILPGVHVASFGAAVVAAAILGIINAFIRPVLMFLAIPIRILTLGLFSLVINALLLMLVSRVVAGFVVDGFFTALVGSLILSVASSIASNLTRRETR
ncbi:MAG: phage holin family protein [Chloroflexota bacterium]